METSTWFKTGGEKPWRRRRRRVRAEKLVITKVKPETGETTAKQGDEQMGKGVNKAAAKARHSGPPMLDWRRRFRKERREEKQRNKRNQEGGQVGGKTRKRGNGKVAAGMSRHKPTAANMSPKASRSRKEEDNQQKEQEELEEKTSPEMQEEAAKARDLLEN
jgi:hypothetical protein